MCRGGREAQPDQQPTKGRQDLRAELDGEEGEGRGEGRGGEGRGGEGRGGEDRIAADYFHVYHKRWFKTCLETHVTYMYNNVM